MTDFDAVQNTTHAQHPTDQPLSNNPSESL